MTATASEPKAATPEPEKEEPSMIERVLNVLFRPSKRVRDAEARALKAVEKIKGTKKGKKIARELTMEVSGMFVLLACLVSCAAPASDQGQGGSTGPTPMVVVNIGTGGGISTTNTSAPTAAPASSASAAQTATNDVKPALGTDAVKAVVDGVKPIPMLGTDGVPVVVPTTLPEPKPETPK